MSLAQSALGPDGAVTDGCEDALDRVRGPQMVPGLGREVIEGQQGPGVRFAGFYSADDERELSMLIDEDTDSGDYEYAVITPGFGIEFRTGAGNVRYKIGKGRSYPAALTKADGIYLTEDVGIAL